MSEQYGNIEQVQQETLIGSLNEDVTTTGAYSAPTGQNVPTDPLKTTGTGTTPIYGEVFEGATGQAQVDPKDEEVPQYVEPVSEPEVPDKPQTKATINAIGSIKAGDMVLVEVRNGEATAIGANGSGDRLMQSLSDVTQHFWADEQGAHVSDEAGGLSGNQVLIRHDGMYIIADYSIIAEFIQEGVFFSDNNEKSLASFTIDGAVIGDIDDNAFAVTQTGLTAFTQGKEFMNLEYYLQNNIGYSAITSEFPVGLMNERGASRHDNQVFANYTNSSMTSSWKDDGTSLHSVGLYVTADAQGTNTGDTASPAIQFMEDSNPIYRGEAYFQSNFKGNLLWSGVYYMNSTHTATFGGKNPLVSNQMSGILLVFSQYTSGTARDYGWNTYFVPKGLVEKHPGVKVTCFMADQGIFGIVGGKELYIYDNKITGHANNVATGTGASGIKYTNNAFVLRYVYGV